MIKFPDEFHALRLYQMLPSSLMGMLVISNYQISATPLWIGQQLYTYLCLTLLLFSFHLLCHIHIISWFYSTNPVQSSEPRWRADFISPCYSQHCTNFPFHCTLPLTVLVPIPISTWQSWTGVTTFCTVAFFEGVVEQQKQNGDLDGNQLSYR